jgi:cyclic-di-GMP phosphodiesterase TipF (flagellum assembly factor)
LVPADEVYQRVTLAGLTIIASGIGDATAQRRLLATGVRLGQGPLFGAPRRLSLDGVAPSEQSAAA